MVCVDLSESTEKILKEAEVLAKAFSAKAWLLHIAEPELEVGGDVIRNATAEIQEMADRLRKAGIDTTALLLQTAAVDTILKEASKLDVDIIVLGSHGRGTMHQLLMGSICEGVIRKSESPILVIPTHERT